MFFRRFQKLVERQPYGLSQGIHDIKAGIVFPGFDLGDVRPVHVRGVSHIEDGQYFGFAGGA